MNNFRIKNIFFNSKNLQLNFKGPKLSKPFKRASGIKGEMAEVRWESKLTQIPPHRLNEKIDS